MLPGVLALLLCMGVCRQAEASAGGQGDGGDGRKPPRLPCARIPARGAFVPGRDKLFSVCLPVGRADGAQMPHYAVRRAGRMPCTPGGVAQSASSLGVGSHEGRATAGRAMRHGQAQGATMLAVQLISPGNARRLRHAVSLTESIFFSRNHSKRMWFSGIRAASRPDGVPVGSFQPFACRARIAGGDAVVLHGAVALIRTVATDANGLRKRLCREGRSQGNSARPFARKGVRIFGSRGAARRIVGGGEHFPRHNL